MKLVSVKGIVVKSMPFKESSKILNIFTKEYGIIGVVSKGCKSIKSTNRVISENFTYATFNISYKENGLSTLINGDVINYLINVKSDIVKFSYFSYLISFVTEVYKQNNAKNLFDLLVNGLLKIENGLNYKVIKNIVEIKCLDYIGIGINVDSCTICNSNKVITFSHERGGLVCDGCKKNEIIYDVKVIKMLRLYKYVDISKVSNIDISLDVINQINDILDNYINDYSGINIKSRNFLRNIEN